MGLSSDFEHSVDGVVSRLVMNTVISLVLFKNSLIKWWLQVVAGAVGGAAADQEYSGGDSISRVSVTRYESLVMCNNINKTSTSTVEWCCVCLCGFKGEEEVSQLISCKHFFHKACLDKWFDNHHITCPLCRSIV